MSRYWAVGFVLAASALAAGCGSSSSPSDVAGGGSAAVPAALCGPGSLPETALQGEVPAADRKSGRNQQGYRCNLELVGQYQGAGASVVNPAFAPCAYLSTSGTLVDPLQILEPSPGTQVVDVSDPQLPKLAGNLTGPSMLVGTWESLKVNASRKLLGGAAVGLETGAAFFDVYDISDCKHPVHKNEIAGTPIELPDNVLAHEGNWSPDGMTYWTSGNSISTLTAIDVSDPASPKILYSGFQGSAANHGIEVSADGNTLYLSTCFPGGVTILDVTEIQKRVKSPQVRTIGEASWNPGSCGQHALPVTWGGKPYLVSPDEFDSEGVHIIDISDPTKPKIVNQIQLEIELPQYAETRVNDVVGDGIFGYEAHYCSVDRTTDPTALACGFFQSGIRVFDVRDPMHPREIAYYNPPAQVGKGLALQHSLHAWIGGLTPTISDLNSNSSPAFEVNHVEVDARYVFQFVAQLPNLLQQIANGDPLSGNMSADWCSSPPQFVNGMLWATCMDNGFMALKFTNGAYPIQ